MMNRRKQREPLASADALLGAASGLAEALLVLCAGNLPRAERQAALAESRWYMQWFKTSGIHVELKDAAGQGVELRREAFPTKAVASITLRSIHAVSLPMVDSLLTKGDESGLQALLARRTALGSAILTLPVTEPGAGDERFGHTRMELC
jgi:hypothetical protein